MKLLSLFRNKNTLPNFKSRRWIATNFTNWKFSLDIVRIASTKTISMIPRSSIPNMQSERRGNRITHYWIDPGVSPEIPWPYPAWIKAFSNSGLILPPTVRRSNVPQHQNVTIVPKDPIIIPAKAAHRTMMRSSSIAGKRCAAGPGYTKRKHTHTTEQNNWSVSVLMRALSQRSW